MQVEVNETGTVLSFQPGTLVGGRVEHSCSLGRGIGYWLEPILALAPFCRDPLHLTLTGVTNNQTDPRYGNQDSASPDLVITASL